MSFAERQMIGPRVGLWIVTALGLVVCAAIGMMLGSDSVGVVIVIATLSLGLAWVTQAKQRWWLLVPAAGTLGGYFWFGFKLYPHEVALAGCLIPLLMTTALRRGNRIENRPPFPTVLYLLSFYLLAHWLGSNIYNKLDTGGGYGNVTRAYFNAYWVIIFLIAFWRYGSTKFIPAALLLSYLAAGARVVVGLFTYFTNGFAYVPVINYVLPGSTHARGADLRFSGLALATSGGLLFSDPQRLSPKIVSPLRLPWQLRCPAFRFRAHGPRSRLSHPNLRRRCSIAKIVPLILSTFGVVHFS